MRNNIILSSALVIVLSPAVAMADCKGLIGCTFNIVGAAAKTVIKGAWKPVPIITATIVAATNSHAKGDNAGEIVLHAIGGAVVGTAEAIVDTVNDVADLGSAVSDAL